MNKTKNKTDLKTKQKNNTAPKAKTGDVAKSQAAAKPKAPAKSKSTAQTEKSSEPKATFKIRKNHNLDPYFDGEKLYAVGGGRYIQFNGVGTLPADITGFMDRTGRKPPFMLLPKCQWISTCPKDSAAPPKYTGRVKANCLMPSSAISTITAPCPVLAKTPKTMKNSKTRPRKRISNRLESPRLFL